MTNCSTYVAFNLGKLAVCTLIKLILNYKHVSYVSTNLVRKEQVKTELRHLEKLSASEGTYLIVQI